MPGDGEPAPEVLSVDQHGRPFHLSQLRGRWVVLYFYPKDETVGCTREACAFRDNLSVLTSAGAEVVGVSVQDRAAHLQFAQRYDLPFRLLADPQKRITTAYDALGILGLAKRVTYLVGPDGHIRDVYRSELQPASHVDHVRTRLLELNSPGVGVPPPRT